MTCDIHTRISVLHCQAISNACQLYRRAVSIPKERQQTWACFVVPCHQFLNNTWDSTLHFQPSTVLLIRQLLRKTGPLSTTLCKTQTRDGLQLTLVNCRAWACWLFGPCCKCLSLFGIECYKPNRDDATLATVVMSPPFLGISPSMSVTFTVKCHWTQSYSSDCYGK